MKKYFQHYLLFPITIILIIGCSNSTLDDLVAEEEPLPEVVTYVEVKPIIENKCLNCHSNPPQNGAPMSLEIYDKVKEAVLNRDLLHRINKNQNEDGLMPLGGPRLSQSSIDLIFKWEEDGLLEN